MPPYMNKFSSIAMPRQNAFTLIEMLVVVVILAILATVALPGYIDSVRRARRVEGKAALMKLMQQQERFYNANNRYVAFSVASTDMDAVTFQWYSGDTPKTSLYEISATACDGDAIQECVMLTARPGSAKVNRDYHDEACGDLGLSSAGKKSARLPSCWE